MAYCYDCGKEVKIKIEPREQHRKIKGVNIDFMADQAICLECGEIASDIELQSKIVSKAYTLYLDLIEKIEKIGV